MQEHTITSGLRALPSGRRHVVSELRRRPASIPELARALDRSPMTIRHHLARLAADGLVASAGERRSGGAGRPAFLYRLTEAAEELFPSAAARFAGLLLDELSEFFRDDDRAGAFPQRLAQRAASPHLEWLEGLSPGERLKAAAGILQRESGATELVEGEDGVRLLDYHCAYRTLLRGRGPDDAVCRFHTRYVQELMGAPVSLSSCQGAGDELCCFRVASARAEDRAAVPAVTAEPSPVPVGPQN